MESKRSKHADFDKLVLVPESFLEEMSSTQTQILNLLSGEQDRISGIGDFIPEPEAARLLGRKTTWFWKLRKQGALGFTKVGNKVFYSREDILNLLKRNKKGGTHE